MKYTEELNISTSILGLAKSVLAKKELNQAVEYGRIFHKKGKAAYVKEMLYELLDAMPSSDLINKPVNYCYLNIWCLEQQTRGLVQNASAVIELLAKQIMREQEPSARWEIPLGRVIQHLRTYNTLPQNLLSDLEKYNKIAYAPSKHDFSGLDEHLFSVEESILLIYVALELSRRLIAFVRYRKFFMK